MTLDAAAHLNELRERYADTTDEVFEEYMTEDKKVHLILEGRKSLGAKGPRLEITGAVVNNKRLKLTEEHCYV